MIFDPGFPITTKTNPIGFKLGHDCFDNGTEYRTLDSIRDSLMDPQCTGPDPVYAIMMDVGKKKHQDAIKKRMLLFGVVTYASGMLGDEPIRSQGHIHAVSPSCGFSTPEVYEIWEGTGIIYMQEFADDNLGRCYAVYAKPGDVVVVPPNWAHATISADSTVPLTFGAWCVRDFGFDYSKVRAHHGIAWFPRFSSKNGNNTIEWSANSHYSTSKLIHKEPNSYSNLNIDSNSPIYSQFERDHDRFLFVSNPSNKLDVFQNFVP